MSGTRDENAENAQQTAADLAASFNYLSSAIFPSGIDTRINCRAWTDAEKMEDEIVKAMYDCKTDAS